MTEHASVVRRQLPVRAWMPYALFGLACTLSVVVSGYVSATTHAQRAAELTAERATFEAAAEQVRQQIRIRLDTYIEVARAGAALLSASNEINAFEFRAFVRELRLRERYPGMVGIGFAPRVPDVRLREFLREVSLDTGRPYRIWPAEQRGEYVPVLFLEPIDGATNGAWGFDLASEAILRGVMERARDRGRPTAATGLTDGPLRASDRTSFTLFIPVYRQGVAADTVEARRRWLVGFVISPFDVEHILAPVTASASGLVIEVYDAADERRDLLARPSADDDGPFQSTRELQIADRTWVVLTRSLRTPGVSQWSATTGTLAIGLLLSLLLFRITRAQVHAWEASVRHETELRAVAEALRASEAKARAADRAKDDFLATISHELRTPLNAILGWVRALRHESVPREEHGHALDVVERNALLQARLIEDLLDLSRITRGQMRLDVRPLDVMSVVIAAVEALRPTADAKGIGLHTVGTAGVVIMGDAERMQQIIWNLVANSIKFTPAGGQVHVELGCDDGFAHLSVRDTGIGIDPDFLPHVFERFRQADTSTTRAHNGIGIGLSIVQQLVALHGGSIDVRSDGPGRGAEFLIRFPRARAADGAPLMPAAASMPASTSSAIH